MFLTDGIHQVAPPQQIIRTLVFILTFLSFARSTQQCDGKKRECEFVCQKQQLNLQMIHKQICSLELSIMHLFWSLVRSPVANWCFTLSPVPTVDDKSSLLAATGQNNSHRIVDSGPLYTS